MFEMVVTPDPWWFAVVRIVAIWCCMMGAIKVLDRQSQVKGVVEVAKGNLGRRVKR